MTENTPKKLFLLDAFALIYRSYYAFIRNPRFNSKGVNTSATLGFTNTLVQLLETEDPHSIAVVFDVSAPTFRHEMFKEYKANREEMPEDLRKSIPYIRKIIEAFNIPIIEKEGFEADDVIGTLAQKAKRAGFNTYMMTPDKDYAQLVDEKVSMYKPGRQGDTAEIWGPEEVKKNFGIENTQQVIEILGLTGDSADNIPGCPGIGPKTAEKLIAEFGTIEGIYQNIDKLKGKQKENLIEFEEQVRLSRKLATIVLDVPIEFNQNELVRGEINKEALMALFEDLEFKALAGRLNLEDSKTGTAVQQTLFEETPISQPAETQKENIETVPHQYYLVETEMQRASLRAELSIAESFCFDTETTGLDPHTAEIVCMSFSFRKHEAFCVLLPKKREEAQKILDDFREVFADEKILKIGQNLKYDMLILGNYGIETKGKLFDTMLAHYLIQPEQRHNLDYLCEIYLNYEKIPTTSLIGKKGKNQLNMRSVPKEKLRDYACEDADLTFRLKDALEPELDKFEMRELFETIEMPLVPVLVHMEQAGVKLDIEELKKYAVTLREQIIQVEKEIFELSGEEFNISSPKQLGLILFEKMKISSGDIKRTKTKQYSTAEDVLSKLTDKHPIINKVLEFRSLKKLLSTYVEALPELVNPKTGKIHTSYNQAVTATGRLSSVNPNLQNIPIRDENGREIRRAFIPTDENYTFLSADYSQIELRIMAALSQDADMLKAFGEGKDIHTITAAKIYKVPETEVTPEMRRKAKTANFGIIYGISAFGLSQRLNISRSEARQLIDGYFENFPGVKIFMDKQIELAGKNGYVQTIKGRKRYLNDINSANAVVRGMAERNAINAPIQGSAADIIKIAMINIYKQFENENLQTKMVLQVHDELDFDVYKTELNKVKQIVKTEMEHAVELGVPLTVEMNNAGNWLDAH
ncbi:MAG: DNA polymerase I [Mariniphaga sp.]|jgi:DNA polymerase-1|nr:DNA polymerase I [Mariniphaga sp.]